MSLVVAGLEARRQIQSQLINQAWPKHEYDFVQIDDQEMGPDLIVALCSIMDIADDAAQKGHVLFKIQIYDDKYDYRRTNSIVALLESSNFRVKYKSEIVGTLTVPIYTLRNNLWVKETLAEVDICLDLIIKIC